MPPPSPHTLEEQTNERFSALSDSDVRILDEILRTAEQSESFASLPFHAIFPAYGEVLARNGINTSHDRLYLRFLYRLEKLRRPGQALYEAFEAQLARMGIEIRFSSDEGDDEYEGAEAEEVLENEYELGPVVYDRIEDDAHERDRRRPRSRRASFSSFIEFEEEDTKQRVRADSRASLSRLQDHSGGFGSRMPEARRRRSEAKARERSSRAERATQRNSKHSREGPRMNAETERLFRKHDHRHLVALQQVEQGRTTKARRKGRRSLPTRHHQRSTVDDYTTSEDDSLGMIGSENDRPAELPISPELLYQPTYTQLLRRVAAFEDVRDRGLLRKVLTKWKDASSRDQQDNRILFLTAVNYDQATLLRQAFELWRHLYRVRKHARDTERFFQHLEKRASKAWDAYLVTKALTHWAECAAEEQERTSVARRHIIRLRYFNAWKEITAVNELKVRRQGLQKFFKLWKQKYAHVLSQNSKAVVVYHQNLVEDIYWRWFWAFCEKRAPEWRHARLKRQYLRQWVNDIRSSREMDARISAYRVQRAKENCLEVWADRAGALYNQRQQASEFRLRHIVSRALPAWQLQLKYAPLARKFIAKVDTRVLATALNTIAHKARLQQQAERVNTWRIVRNAWTLWNDRLRWQTLQHHIEDRITVQALYRWVLAERLKLLKRLNEERLVKRAFQSILGKWQTVQKLKKEGFRAVVDSRSKKAVSTALHTWLSRLHAAQNHSQEASEFQTPRLLKRAMQSWHEKFFHLGEMDGWSTEAVFYLRASRSLKQWRAAVSESRKQRLKDAYSIMRRKVKVRIAGIALSRWRDQLTHHHTLLLDADVRAHEHVVHFSGGILHAWRSRLEELSASYYPLAMAQHSQTLLSNSLNSMLSRSKLASTQALQAEDFATSHTKKVACEALRTLLLQVLDSQARASKAAAKFSWSERRRLRVLLRGWAERALSRRSPTAVATTLQTATTTPANEPPGHLMLLLGTPRIAPLRYPPSRLPFRSRPDSAVPPTAATDSRLQYPPDSTTDEPTWPSPPPPPPSLRLPDASYFSTPSKRAARARALAVGGGGFGSSPGPSFFALREGRDGRAGQLQSAGGAPRDWTGGVRTVETPLFRRLLRYGGEEVEGGRTQERFAVGNAGVELGVSIGMSGRGGNASGGGSGSDSSATTTNTTAATTATAGDDGPPRRNLFGSRRQGEG